MHREYCGISETRVLPCAVPSRSELSNQALKSIVDAWSKKAKIGFGIRSIICLLEEQELRLYADLRIELVPYYQENGFQVRLNAKHRRPACNPH
jgi:hypothetical protein